MKHRKIVFGFIRNISDDIPSALFDLCFDFYFMTECFNEELIGNDMIIKDDILQQNEGVRQWNTAFGTVECKDNEIHNWKLKIIKEANYCKTVSQYENCWMCGVIKYDDKIREKTINDYLTSLCHGKGVFWSISKVYKIDRNSATTNWGELCNKMGGTVDIRK